jgi:hypothetical protein
MEVQISNKSTFKYKLELFYTSGKIWSLTFFAEYINKTVNKINERYYWKGIVENLLNNVRYVKRQNKKAKTTVPELNSVSIGQRVWGKI